MLKLFIKITLFNLLCINLLNAKITPTDVFKEAKSIKMALAAEVTKEKGASILPVIDIDLHGATPSSIYALASALNYKLMIYAKSKNKTWKSAKFPNNVKIKPADVRNVLLVVKDNMVNIFGISKFILNDAKNKKPADVGVQLTYANQWLDKIMPFVKPQYPMAMLEKTEKTIDRILANSNVVLSKITPPKHKGMKPKDVFINVASSYNLLRNLKLVYSKEQSAKHPYDVLSATNKIKPLDIYTITTFNLFFLYTLGINFDLSDINAQEPLKLKNGITPNDVYQQADIVNYKLASLIVIGNKGK
jgi:hypothetical protein